MLLVCEMFNSVFPLFVHLIYQISDMSVGTRNTSAFNFVFVNPTLQLLIISSGRNAVPGILFSFTKQS